jgi:hypothetical protein
MDVSTHLATTAQRSAPLLPLRGRFYPWLSYALVEWTASMVTLSKQPRRVSEPRFVAYCTLCDDKHSFDKTNLMYDVVPLCKRMDDPPQ